MAKTQRITYLLIDILNFSHTDGQRFMPISSFDVVRLSDGVRVLGQTCQTVDGVCGHGNNMALLQSLHGATQDFSSICSSKTGMFQEGFIHTSTWYLNTEGKNMCVLFCNIVTAESWMVDGFLGCWKAAEINQQRWKVTRWCVYLQGLGCLS